MNNATLLALQKKAEGEGRMPGITKIHNLLNELKIKHTFRKSENTVEYRSGRNTYVNSRHSGKKGFEIKITNNEGKKNLYLNTSDSYYSWNSEGIARDLLKLISETK